MQRSDYSHTLCKKDFHIRREGHQPAAGMEARPDYPGKQAPGNRCSSLLRGNFPGNAPAKGVIRDS